MLALMRCDRRLSITRDVTFRQQSPNQPKITDHIDRENGSKSMWDVFISHVVQQLSENSTREIVLTGDAEFIWTERPLRVRPRL